MFSRSRAQFRIGDEFLPQTVDARQAPVGLVGEYRQFLVKAPRKVQLNVAGVALDDDSLSRIHSAVGGVPCSSRARFERARHT